MADTVTTDAPKRGERSSDLRIVPLRHWGRIPLGLAVLAALALFLYALAVNPNIKWGVVAEHLTAPAILRGVGVTILLTVASMLIGIVLGVVTAVLRGSDNPVLAYLARGYIWAFRGTPVLVQLIFWYNLGLLFPTIGLPVPLVAEVWVVETNTVITGFTAALLGLGLNAGAYMAEIVRAGLVAVDPGQSEAALAVGMTKGQTLRAIVLPQALRVIVPPTGNEVITMLKTSALVSVISGSDLLTTAQTIYSRNFHVIELLIVVSIWYIALTSILTAGQWALERRLAPGRTVRSTSRREARRA
ncbi:amino acid ABC transporter permease [Sinosporangium siamense]|uniref:ABC transporter permease n=1 Tax=Sinosporangium siamense TaxID=1367973 RepID=A0A919V6Y5_9ACTN|nr:amino acid ABC transporter permease [Sinosporangium siamense]GII92943.1 ABC transporter permease [Sinosporangium siamense]